MLQNVYINLTSSIVLEFADATSVLDISDSGVTLNLGIKFCQRSSHAGPGHHIFCSSCPRASIDPLLLIFCRAIAWPTIFNKTLPFISKSLFIVLTLEFYTTFKSQIHPRMLKEESTCISGTRCPPSTFSWFSIFWCVQMYPIWNPPQKKKRRFVFNLKSF